MDRRGRYTPFFHANHPRTIFLKTLPRFSSVLDVGAGDGTLQLFKSWIFPKREDLKMYAYAMEKGRDFGYYEAYELGLWPDNKPDFGGRKFEAIVAAHFIEHLREPYEFIEWCAERLETAGRIYIEWPSESSKNCPPISDVRAAGIPLIISNFYDDRTHIEIPSIDKVAELLRNGGVAIEQQGIVTNPFAEEEIRARIASGASDDFLLQVMF